MIGAALADGLRRARGEGRLALWLAAPSLLAAPLVAAPVYRALGKGLPADRDLLGGLDGAAAVDLLNRAWPAHQEAVWVAVAAGAGLWLVGGFLLYGAAARALARGRRRVSTARLFGTLGTGLGPLSRLLAVAVALHGAAFLLMKLADGFLELAHRAALTDAEATAFAGARLAVAAGLFVLVRCWCRLAVAVSARERSCSALEAFARAAALAIASPGIAAVDLGVAGAGVAAAALASIPRWALPQGGWAPVLLGLLLALAPVLVRAACRTVGIAATLEALALATARRPAAGGESPGRTSLA